MGVPPHELFHDTLDLDALSGLVGSRERVMREHPGSGDREEGSREQSNN
jgi:hypothetical protein